MSTLTEDLPAKAYERDLGEVSTAGSDLKVIFRRRYARPAAKVWAAVTTPERLADWLAQAEIEPRVGGRMRLTWSDVDFSMEGEVVAYDPPRTFAWTWPLDGRDTVVTFDITPDGDGCWLTLTHAGLDPTGKEGNGVRAGWHAHLEGVADAIDGRATPWATVVARETEIARLYPKLSA